MCIHHCCQRASVSNRTGRRRGTVPGEETHPVQSLVHGLLTQTCSVRLFRNLPGGDENPKQYSPSMSLLCSSSLSLPNWNFSNFCHSIQNQAVVIFCYITDNIWTLRPFSLVILLPEITILQVKQRSQYTIAFGDQCKWLCSMLYWIFLHTLLLSPKKLLKSYKAQMANKS